MRSTVHFVDRLEKQVPNASFFGSYLPAFGKNIWLSALLVLLGQLATAQVAPCFVTNTNAPSVSVAGTYARQSFVATCTGQITSIVLKFQAAPGQIALTVYEDLGGGDCGSTPVGASIPFTASLSGALTTVDLSSSPIPVVSGHKYVVHLSSSLSFRVYFNGTTNPYAGGRMTWGATCPSNSPYTSASDMYFRVNIGVLTVAKTPDINILGGMPAISIADEDNTPSALDDTDFGAALPTTPITHSFTIQNTGDDTLRINTVSIDVLNSTHPGDFSVTQPLVLKLPPVPPPSSMLSPYSTTFTVTFTPLAIGLRRARLAVTSNDPNESPYNFDIQGRFNCPEILATITGNILVCPGGNSGSLPVDLYSSTEVLSPPFTVVLSDNSVHTVGDVGPALLPVTVSQTAGSFSIVSVKDRYGCLGTTSGVAQVIRRDIEPPIITYCPPSPPPATAISGQCYAAVNLGGPALAEDNCGTPVVTNDAPTTGQLPAGETVVTWTAMDASGNAATCSQTVVVIDNTPPSITCPPVVQIITLELDTLCRVVLPDLRDLVTGTDECPLTITQCVTSYYGGGDARLSIEECLEPGDYLDGVNYWPVTITATDPSGNQAVCSNFLIITEDHIVPTISCPPSITVSSQGDPEDFYSECSRRVQRSMGPICGYSPYFCVTDSVGSSYCEEFLPLEVKDNCDSYVSYELSGASEGAGGKDDFKCFAFFELGTTTVVWTVIDVGGNTANCTYSVTVEDIQAPIVVCPYILPNSFPERNTCDVYTALPNEFDLITMDTVITTDTIIIIDMMGDTTVTIDTTITVVHLPLYSDNCSTPTPTYTLSGATVGDGASTLSGVVFQQGTTAVVWTVTDDSGNSSSCSFSVVVGDTIPPVISGCLMGVVSQFTDTGCAWTATDFPPVSVADNCTVQPALSYTLNGVTTGTGIGGSLYGILMNQGTTRVLFTATDAAGNTSTCAFSIVVTDDDAPTIICPVNNVITACSLEINDASYDPIIADNCVVTSVTYELIVDEESVGFGGSTLAGETLGYGTTTVQWSATDLDGNRTSTNCEIMVTGDVTDPYWITLPGGLDRTVACGDDTAFDLVPAAADDCSGIDTLVRDEGDFVAGCSAYAGTWTYNWTVVDRAGNSSSSFTQVITVVDNTSPTWNASLGSLDRTLQCSDTTGLFAAQALAPVAMDCDPGLVPPSKVSGMFVAGSCPKSGTYTNTWTATDACGNVSTFVQVITLVDNTPPTWVDRPGDLDFSFSCNDVMGLEEAQGVVPVPTDNCTVLGFTIRKNAGTFVPGACPNAGTYTNTFIAVDECGNSSTAYTQVITIYDNIAPAWVSRDSSGDVTLTCSDVNGLIAAQAWRPVATDSCDASVNIAKQAGIRTGTVCGTITNTFIATDDCGNAASTVFTQVITIVDNVLPTITCPANTTVALNANCAASLGAYTATATDNCGTPTVAQSPASGTPVLIGVPLTVTMTATDACGNSSSCNFLVTARDNIRPTISCPTAVTPITLVNCTAPLPAYSAASVSDNCTANPIVTQSPAAGNAVTSAGTTVVTLTATDGAGLTQTCSIAVTVRTGITPSISCPSNTTVNLNASCQFALPNYTTAATVNYPCAGAVVTQNPVAGTILAGVTVRTVVLTVTTPEGVATCSFTVTTRDVTLPTVTCPGPQFLEMGTNCRATVPDYRGQATWGDNCTASTSILKQQLAPYTPGAVVTGLGPVTVTLRARDAAGNTRTCTFTVTRVDNTAPFCSGDAGNLVEDRDNTESVETTAFDFELAPNPATDQVNLSLYGLQGTALVSVIDQLGRTVWEQTIETEQTNLQIDLGADRFDSGLYLVTVRSDGSMVTKRLILTK